MVRGDDYQAKTAIDYTVYNWINAETGVVESLTGQELRTKYPYLTVGDVTTMKTTHYSAKKWKRLRTDDDPLSQPPPKKPNTAKGKPKPSISGKNNHNYNHTVYRWEHIETNEVVEMTKYDFRITKNIGKYKLQNHAAGLTKSCDGWRLLGENLKHK